MRSLTPPSFLLLPPFPVINKSTVGLRRPCVHLHQIQVASVYPLWYQAGERESGWAVGGQLPVYTAQLILSDGTHTVCWTLSQDLDISVTFSVNTHTQYVIPQLHHLDPHSEAAEGGWCGERGVGRGGVAR